MIKKKKAPIAALAAAALMSAAMAGSIPASAADEYILLLPASTDSSYALDQSHVSTTYSTDQYTILLYEEGETVQFQVFTNHDYTIQDAATATDFDDYYANGKGNVFFTMPNKDLCLILGTELSTSGSTGTATTGTASASTVTDPSSILAAETQTGTASDLSVDPSAILAADNGVDAAIDAAVDSEAVDVIADALAATALDSIADTEEFDEPAIEIVIEDETLEFNETEIDTEIITEADTEADTEAETNGETWNENTEFAVYPAGEIGLEFVLNGDCDGQVSLLDGNAVDIEQDGTYESSEIVDLLRVNAYSWFDTDPSVNVWKDGEPVEDTSALILEQGGTGNNWYVDIRNSFDLDGYYVVQVTMDGYSDRAVISSDDYESAEIEAEEDEDGSIQIVLFDGLQAKAKARNKKSYNINKDGDKTIETKLKNITVTSDDGVPSSLEYEAYKNDEPIDDSELIGNESIQKKGHVISLADGLIFDSDYKLIITLADDNEFIDPDDIEEEETEEEEDDQEDDQEEETERVPNSGITIVQESSSNSVTEGDDFIFSVEIADGYAKTDDFAVKANDVVLDENSDGTYTISGISADQNVTVEGVADVINPTIEVSVDNITWTDESDESDSIYFFKGPKTVEIKADDEGSGLSGIQYYISETPVSDPYEITDWVDYTEPVELPENQDAYIYVLAWDYDGNSSMLCSGKAVMYSDITSDTDSVSLAKSSDNNISVPIELNGNFIDLVILDGDELNDYDYDVDDDGRLTVHSSCLKALDAGTHTIEVTILPLGDEYTESSAGDEPSSLTIELDITKEEGTVDDISDISKSFDGETVEEPSFNSSNQADEDVVVEYKLEDEDDSEYTTDAPVEAGNYTVRVTVPEDDDHDAAVGTSSFTISKGDVTITANDQSVYSGDEIETDVDQADASGLPDGFVLDDVTLTEDDGIITADDAVILDDDGNDVTDNFDITYVDGTMETMPIEQDAPDGLTSEAETIKGKADGKINGLTTDMEYSEDGDNYTAVTDTDMTFTGGDYYIRYAANDKLLPSDPVTVTVNDGKMLTIVFMVDSDILETMDVEYGASLDDSEIPAVTLSNGYTPADAYWDVTDFSDITNDIVAHAVYTIEEFSVTLPSDVSVVTASDDSSEGSDNNTENSDDDAEDFADDADDTEYADNYSDEDAEVSDDAETFEIVYDIDGADEGEDAEIDDYTESADDASGVKIVLEDGITADITFTDGHTVSINALEPYTVAEQVDTITIYPAPDSNAQLEMDLWEDGAEVDYNNNLFFIETVADGTYTIRLSDEIDFSNDYNFSVSEIYPE